MTPKSPSSCCLYAVSSILTNTTNKPFRPTTLTFILRPSTTPQLRHYVQQKEPPNHRKPVRSPQPSTSIARTALEAISSGPSHQIDPINPPRSVLPPPLTLPERSDFSNVFYYYLNIGRAYGGFYKEGVKAVWYNYRAAKVLRSRITNDLGAQDRFEAAAKGVITRSEWQLLARNDHDIGKLPFFTVLVLLFGEWLPLLVPFMPGVVPGTCRIPKQVAGMKGKAEERRRASFRQGVEEPGREQVVVVDEGEHVEWPLSRREYVGSLLDELKNEQLFHLSSSLGLHSSLWDRVQLPPPAFLLRRALAKRLRYIALDDRLLIKDGGVAKLNPVELDITCQERGLDTMGRKDSLLRDHLDVWLTAQRQDRGMGRAMLTMLFKRPSSWKTLTDR